MSSAALHPSADALTCPAEPPALTDAQVIADVDGNAERSFNTEVLVAGRECRDALARECLWHVERGMDLPPGMSCGNEQLRREAAR